VEGQAWLEVINRNVQQLLSQSSFRDREIELCGLPDLGLEIIVDGKAYQGLDEIPDAAVRDLIQAAIDEWQDEAEAAVFIQAPLSAQHPAPFRSRLWLVAWLLAMILALVLPSMFVTPAHMAARFSLLWAGGMLGGLIGALVSRATARRVMGNKNSWAVMLWGVLGGGLAVPLGFAVTAGILSLVP
jgi:hypothetical protein